MPKAKGAILRLVLVGLVGLTALAGPPANLARAAAAPEQVLPDSTIFFLKVADVTALREAFKQSQYGQLWNDPAMAEIRADVSEKLQSSSDAVKEKLGVTLKELLELPQGALAVAVIGREDPNVPISVAIIADAGENADKLSEVLVNSNKRAEESGAKVSVETFQDNPLHVIAPPEQANNDGDTPPPPPLVWTRSDSVFYIGSDVDAIKDLVTNAGGRSSGALGAEENYTKTLKKVDGDTAHAVWFLDIGKLVKLVTRVGAKGAEAQAQQIEFLLQELGVNGLKSAGGSVALNAGNYNSVTKTFFNAPAPVQGLLKLFSFPPIAMRPEPWVPATVASYQSFSWDLDNAYNALNDLVNKFQPGMLNVLEQQLVGPEGGQPLSFQNDIFGPLGNRITMISDFKKPIQEDSQRVVVAIALDDARAFQGTLDRILAMVNANPKKRDFQGTTILDFDLPELPNQGGAQVSVKGPVSVAIANDTLYATTDGSLLEQVLRPGAVPLSESSAYQTVAKELPEQVSGMTFVRPDEQARLSYDMLKSGNFQKAIRQAIEAGRQGKPGPEIPQLIDPNKLPDFEVFAKYLTLGGSYSVMDDDGFTQTGFSLRKTNP